MAESSAQFGVPLTTVIDSVSYLSPFNLFRWSFDLCLENLASILELDENLNEYFNIYTDAPENERSKEMQNNVFGGSTAPKGEENFFI